MKGLQDARILRNQGNLTDEMIKYGAAVIKKVFNY